MAFFGAEGKQTRFADFNRVAAWLDRGAPGAKVSRARHVEHPRVRDSTRGESARVPRRHVRPAPCCGRSAVTARRRRARCALENRGEVRTWLHDAVSRVARGVAGRARARARDDAPARDRGDRRARRGRRARARRRRRARAARPGDGLARAGQLASSRATASPRPCARSPARPRARRARCRFGTPDRGARARRRRSAAHRRRPDARPRRARCSPATPRCRAASSTGAAVDVDDAQVWSVSAAPGPGAGKDREQRLVRVRRSVTRVAWNGTRPVVAEAARGWTRRPRRRRRCRSPTCRARPTPRSS